MKKLNDINKIIISILLLFFSFCLFFTDKIIKAEQPLAEKLKGKILLQVEENGEAWYVHPLNQQRYYLGRPADAFALMRESGIGITNEDIEKISIAKANFEGLDDDEDGLSNAIEDSLGTDKNNPDTDGDGYNDKTEILNNFNPLGEDKLPIDNKKAESLAGLIILQVEKNGEAWYINPDNLKRYYLGRPTDAFNLMRTLGLGITNINLAKIEEYIKNPELNQENIKNKYTTPVPNNPAQRKYLDPDNKFSIDYPSGWRIIKFEKAPNSVQFTDSNSNFYLEKKGIITVDYFTTDQEFENISDFRIATLNNAKKITDEKKQINNNDAYENTFEHERTYQKTTTIKINSNEFVRLGLATTKENFNSYNNIYQSVLNSLEISE